MRALLLLVLLCLVTLSAFAQTPQEGPGGGRPPRQMQLTPEEIATYTANLKSENTKDRNDAMSKLARGKQDAILLAALKDADVEMRVRLLYALQQCMTPAVVDAYIDILHKDPDTKVRQTAVGILPHALTNPRVTALYPKIKQALVEATNDADDQTAETALQRLPKDDTTLVPAYLEIIKTNTRPRIRAIALERLVSLKDPCAYDVLIGLIEDPQRDVAAVAIHGLGRIGDRRATPQLLTMLKNTQRPSDCISAAGYALSLLADPAALNDLLTLARQGARQDVRLGAISALAGYRDAAAGDMLITLLRDTDPTIRRETAYALSRNGYKPAVTPLMDAYTVEKYDSGKDMIFSALAALADPKCYDLFIATLESDKSSLRGKAVVGLRNLKDPRAVDALMRLYPKEPPAERANIARAFKAIDDPRPLEMLIADFLALSAGGSVDNYASDINAAIVALMGRGFTRGFWVGPPGSKPKEATIPVGLRSLQPDTPWKLGSDGAALLTLYNGTPYAVVVSRVRSTLDTGAAAIPLSGPVRHPIVRLPGTDTYVYRETPGDAASSLALHAGLLLPGQIVQVVLPHYHSIGVQDRYLVDYWQAEKPYDGTPASLAPFTVRMPHLVTDATGLVTERHLVPFEDTRWRALCAGHERVPITGPSAGLRSVLLEGTLPALQQSECAVTAPCERLKYSTVRLREAAARIAGVEAAKLAFTYSAALGRYLIGEPDGACWTMADEKQTARGAVLPHVPFALYGDVDRGGARIQVRATQPAHVQPDALTGAKLWNTYPLRAGDGRAMAGEFFTLTPADLAAFLATLAEKKATLTQHPMVFGEDVFVLVGGE